MIKIFNNLGYFIIELFLLVIKVYLLDYGVLEYIFYMYFYVYLKRGFLVGNWFCMVGGVFFGDNK